MTVEPVRSTRIYEEIVRQVKLLIADGKLKSGDRLPPERELAEKFVVSRTSVREALRALESRGLVEIRAGEGAFIRDISLETLIEPLALVILPHREAVGELFEARRMLEPAIAALAARRATPEEIAEMQRILDDQAREVSQGRTGLAQDAAFHAALAQSAHNRAISTDRQRPDGPPDAEPRGVPPDARASHPVPPGPRPHPRGHQPARRDGRPPRGPRSPDRGGAPRHRHPSRGDAGSQRGSAAAPAEVTPKLLLRKCLIVCNNSLTSIRPSRTIAG